MELKGKDYLSKENAKRNERYSKNSEKEDFFFSFNDHLASFEPKDAPAESFDMPLILVVGLPRSGTTLLMQWLAKWLEIGYVNNVMAKFWLAPSTGYRFSQDIIKEKEANYSSDFGKTDALSAPHEFSYFWINWLGITNDPPYDPVGARERIDWDGLTSSIKNMQRAAGTGFMFKGLHPCRHLAVLKERFPKLLVVHIKRNPIDVAHSLKKARVSYYGDPSHWWSLVTPNYNELLKLGYTEQIPMQMKTIDDEFEANISLLDESNKLRVSFDDLVERPVEVLNLVKEKLDNLSENQISYMDVPSQDFAFKKQSVREEDTQLTDSVKNIFSL